MQALQHPIDYIPLVIIAVAALFLLALIVRLWPDLVRERAADVEEIRRVERLEADAANSEHESGHSH